MVIDVWTASRLARSGGLDVDREWKALDGLSPEQAEAELEEAVDWLYAVESAEEAEKARFSEIDREFLGLVRARARRKYRIAFRLMTKFQVTAERALRFARAEIGPYLLAEIYEASRDRDASVRRKHTLACEHREVWPVAAALFFRANH